MIYSKFTSKIKKAITRFSFKRHPDTKQDHTKENVIGVNAYMARGNLSLQNGWYYTEEDIQKLKKKVLNYTYINK
ncbi:MAG: hypothetical protein HQL93_05425 [Magnetococcales bacterium]|nr:hypothetical protein [Magnetococcales bacterium]